MSPELAGESSFKVKLNNLCRMVKAVKLSIDRSPKLHEMTVRDALNFLCNDFGREPMDQHKIDNKMTELFQCFNLIKSIPTVTKFIEVGYYFKYTYSMKSDTFCFLCNYRKNSSN